MSSFEELTLEFPTKGELGVTHKALFKDYTHISGDSAVLINTTVMRDDDGTLIGVVKQFPHGRCVDSAEGILLSGECIVRIHRTHQRKGLGLELLRAADQQWQINFNKQHYAAAGKKLVDRYLLEKFGRPRVARSCCRCRATP